MSDSPAARVRARMQHWIDLTGLSHAAFAAAIGRKKSWLQAIMAKKNDLRLDDLDAVAQAMRTTASELVRATADRYQLELTPTEVRIIEQLRRESPDYVLSLLTLLRIRPSSAENSRQSAKNV